MVMLDYIKIYFPLSIFHFQFSTLHSFSVFFCPVRFFKEREDTVVEFDTEPAMRGINIELRLI